MALEIIYTLIELATKKLADSIRKTFKNDSYKKII